MGERWVMGIERAFATDAVECTCYCSAFAKLDVHIRKVDGHVKNEAWNDMNTKEVLMTVVSHLCFALVVS